VTSLYLLTFVIIVTSSALYTVIKTIIMVIYSVDKMQLNSK